MWLRHWVQRSGVLVQRCSVLESGFLQPSFPFPAGARLKQADFPRKNHEVPCFGAVGLLGFASLGVHVALWPMVGVIWFPQKAFEGPVGISTE